MASNAEIGNFPKQCPSCRASDSEPRKVEYKAKTILNAQKSDYKNVFCVNLNVNLNSISMFSGHVASNADIGNFPRQCPSCRASNYEPRKVEYKAKTVSNARKSDCKNVFLCEFEVNFNVSRHVALNAEIGNFPGQCPSCRASDSEPRKVEYEARTILNARKCDCKIFFV